MPSNLTDEPWIKSKAPCHVASQSADMASKYWFKSSPVDRDFCFRVTQLQLCTYSRDQGTADNKEKGSWTWFELVILANEDDTEPKRSKEGKELVWRSHSNRLANDKNPTLHFGATFDRRSELLSSLEVGDVVAVRVCSRFKAWVNYADRGYVTTRRLEQDLFTPHQWTLSSDVIPSLSQDVEDGSYSFVSTTPCFVQASSGDLASMIWFTTPALDQDAIDRFEAIQLFTHSRFQRITPETLGPDDSFSWFDIVILDSPHDTVPRSDNGVSLVWHSHSNDSREIDEKYGLQGKRFDLEEDDPKHADVRKRGEMIKGALKPGNALGVRVCAQYPAWENYARVGQLVVRISNTAPLVQPTELPDVTEALDTMAQVKEAAEKHYAEVGYISATVAALSNEARADLILESPPAYAEPRPLRLLCLDGGGVRGVSELCILKRLMEEIARQEGKSKPDEPHQYFDMIAGTSTGGLIAIMLGRLKMSIEDCERAYDDISKKVFGKRRKILKFVELDETRAFLATDYMYEEKPLEDAVRQYVKDRLGDPEATLYEDNPSCRVLVMSALASVTDDAKTAVHLRSYDVGKTLPSSYTNFRIWEAARATSAAPIFFKQFEKNGKSFVDGGMGWNNPVFELVSELYALHGANFRIGALVSLGTGVPVKTELPPAGLGSINEYIVVPTNSENPAATFQRIAPILPLPGEEKYWRLNLNKASCQGYPIQYDKVMTEMDDWKAIEDIRRLTNLWLSDKARVDDIVACAKKIVGA